ncbi:efflux RND transporter periplasmic adaptor subunit [uncultured Alistipes sp.]|uniref:efflux RND transporter periplasmic adaptor subunit n=1 Tax=uncultured Alistipes sp. TaxID=538949 RepID=UPI00280376AD|nr:efflux RND transporter periplasmic adaptor subunit [uncultured Alistipes sp.]
MKQTFVKAAVWASCLAAVACGQAPTAMGPGEYAVMTVASTDREIPTNYSATIRGRQDIDIYPQVSGTIWQLCVNEGQSVTKGQTLFIIDQVPYKAALKTAEANVAAAEASVATAQLTYDSKKELFARNVVSQYDLSTAENSLLTAKAQLAQAEAQQVNAANNLSYTVVKAPSNGVVGTLPYRVGALVSASMPQPLTTVSDNSTMYVYFSMTENQLLNLTRRYGSINETIKNMPDVQLQLNDGSMYDQKGRVESISGVIDTSTGSVSLRAAFPNPNGLLHSGGSGNVVLTNTFKDCIVVPQAATFEIQDKVFAYKVQDGKAVAAPLSVETISNGQEYIVKSGLVPGDVIVTEGVGLMREGTPIRPKGEAAAAAGNTDQAAAQTTQAAQEKNSEEAAAQTQTEKEE